MCEEEINDNLIMLKYFLKEERDENWQDYCNAIQGLLDLYQKEKEKNKELVNADLTTVYMNGFYDGEKKWKDKIKEKIDYYKEMEEPVPKEDVLFKANIHCKIQVLQELLEERN